MHESATERRRNFSAKSGSNGAAALAPRPSSVGVRGLPRFARMAINLPTPLLFVAALGACSFFVSGCASVKALPETKQDGPALLRWPSEIYLRPFDISSGKWEGNTRKEPKRREIRDWLMAELEQRLGEIAPTRVLAPASPARDTAGDDLPKSGWLVTGRFIRVNPGSKFQRMFIGLGAGGSRLETKISVYDLAVSPTEPLITFLTSGGSNLAAGPQTIFNNESEGDIERTAREARDFLRERIGARESQETLGPSSPNMEPVEIGAPPVRSGEPQDARDGTAPKPRGRS
jgi:hypothetical protein